MEKTFESKETPTFRSKPSTGLPPHNLNNPRFIYILSKLSPKKRRTENRQNIIANNLCQFLPFTYTWARKGKTGLKQNNTNETLVTVISGDTFI